MGNVSTTITLAQHLKEAQIQIREAKLQHHARLARCLAAIQVLRRTALAAQQILGAEDVAVLAPWPGMDDESINISAELKEENETRARLRAAIAMADQILAEEPR